MLGVPQKVPENACEEAVMSFRRTTGGVVALLLLGLLVSPAWAQTVEPYEIDFGTVNVGEWSTKPFTVSNPMTSPLSMINIETIELTAGDTDVFSVDWYVFQLPPDGSITYNVTFEPPEARVEPYYATLTLTYTIIGLMGSPGGELSVDLIGVGDGGAPQNPVDMIDALIEEFDEWESLGSLKGTGRGKFKKPRHKMMRLRVVRLMLRSAKRLIYRGYYDWACWQLYSILKHADGLPRPWDFVTGTARQAFTDQVRELMSVLEGY